MSDAYLKVRKAKEIKNNAATIKINKLFCVFLQIRFTPPLKYGIMKNNCEKQYTDFY